MRINYVVSNELCNALIGPLTSMHNHFARCRGNSDLVTAMGEVSALTGEVTGGISSAFQQVQNTP
jgi:hypothetical protein